MRHTTQVNLEVGGAMFFTYDSAKKDFEKSIGAELLDAGGMQ